MFNKGDYQNKRLENESDKQDFDNHWDLERACHHLVSAVLEIVNEVWNDPLLPQKLYEAANEGSKCWGPPSW